MVVDITSVSVLENMYNILTEWKTLEGFFSKQVTRAVEHWCDILKGAHSLCIYGGRRN